MKGFALTLLIFTLFSLGPLLDMVFHVPMLWIVGFYFGVLVGICLGVLAHKAELQDRAKRAR